ncbi:MAG: hypothetical protein E6248_09860 [Clostridium sp.]|uniref:hypothetical protein n=1 Tax=Clostridium sp. TaxID=1506 RepID=UPI002907E872|nr:hypothetical protein [Clostridium sp.]MDU5110742.1 hypothetical protein [Clostridium sp.]
MCLTSNLMSQDKILVLKATKNTVNEVIDKGIYALTNLPNNYNQFEKFVLVDEANTNETKVLAVGTISEPSAINSNSNSINIFKNSKCRWEYQLFNVVDLRGDSLTLEDVFMESGLDNVNYAVQF